MLDPEYANFSAAPPLLLEANSIEDEIAYALLLIEGEIQEDKNKKACIAFCGYSLYQIQKFGEKIGIKVLDGSISIGQQQLYLSDLEHTKGFEFDTMIIVNCSFNVLPNKSKPEKEQFRDLSRFYVAMTRAKNQLVVSYSVQKSELLQNSLDDFLTEEWSTYIPSNNLKVYGKPRSLESIRHSSADEPIEEYVLKLSGPPTGYDYAATNI